MASKIAEADQGPVKVEKFPSCSHSTIRAVEVAKMVERM